MQVEPAIDLGFAARREDLATSAEPLRDKSHPPYRGALLHAKYAHGIVENFRRGTVPDADTMNRLRMFNIKVSVLEFIERISNYNALLKKHFRSLCGFALMLQAAATTVPAVPDHSVAFLHGFAALTQTPPEGDLR